jgi:hypothetical protein
MNSAEFEQVSQRQGKVAAEIFKLRERVDLYLMANDTEAANKILILISILEGERAKRP